MLRPARGRAFLVVTVAAVAALSLGACAGRKKTRIVYEERPEEVSGLIERFLA